MLRKSVLGCQPMLLDDPSDILLGWWSIQSQALDNAFFFFRVWISDLLIYITFGHFWQEVDENVYLATR